VNPVPTTHEVKVGMTNDPEPALVTQSPEAKDCGPEERLRSRISMLTQLLIVAAVVVALQFGIMIKVLMESAK
jgi:hypothetical protein